MAKFNQPDPRNEGTWCWVNGLVRREDAKVSVLDSVVQGGDAVWEGLRVADGRIYQMDEHLKRLVDSAHALQFADIPAVEDVRQAVFDVLAKNGMTDGVHIRLTLSRGMKSTSGMDPRLNVFGSTLVVLPEYKGAVYGSGQLKLVTSAIRRNAPSFLDSKIHHNNLLNNILAKIQANHAGRRRRGDARRPRVPGRDQRHEFVPGARRGAVHAVWPRLLAGHHPRLHLGPRAPTGHRRPRGRFQLDRTVHRRRSVHHRHHGRVGPHCGSGRSDHWDRTWHTSWPSDPGPPRRLRASHPFHPIAPTMTWLKSAGWVASCALISVGLGWWLGQGAQDWMAPEVSRPTSLDPEALHVFLTQLPWQAHAARLAGHALGLAVATVLLTVNTPQPGETAWHLGP